MFISRELQLRCRSQYCSQQVQLCIMFHHSNFRVTVIEEEFYRIFPDAVFRHSPLGWMDQDLFYNCLEQSFISKVEKCCIPKPILLLIDGAKVHISLFISELCDENNYIVYCLPNLAHLLQALGLELMGSIKTTYYQEVRKWLLTDKEQSYDKTWIHGSVLHCIQQMHHSCKCH